MGAIIVAVLVCSAMARTGRAAQPQPQYVEGDAIVVFKPHATVASAKSTAARHSAKFQKHFGWLSAQRNRTHALLRSTTKTTEALIAELSRDPDVEFAEPNYLRWPNASPPPNDPLFPKLWALNNTGQTVNGTAGTTNADIAYLKAIPLARTNANRPVVAVIDTGIDYGHPDLISNLWSNPGEIPGNGLDDDGNGYPDDTHGYDFYSNSPEIADISDHGTHVAGTIAATVSNYTGVTGVCRAARIMALKAAYTTSALSDDAIIGAVNYASMMRGRGVNVVAINASFSGISNSVVERSAIEAAGNAGIIFCAAAGNDGLDIDTRPRFPASYPLTNIISVAASDQRDRLATFSNYGDGTVDLAAPGVNILSSVPEWLTPTNTSSVVRPGRTYAASGLAYAGSTTGVTGLIFNCGIGTNFPAGVSNNIALIKRGELFFSQKVSNAMTAGATAAIIYNNDSSPLFFTLGASGPWIPAVAISLNDGQNLIATGLPLTGVVFSVGPYQYLEGTSMATPHVSGAVAFAADNFPSETMRQRVARILASVTKLSILNGKVATGGRLNLARVVDSESDGLPDWWEQDYFSNLSQTPESDPDFDGLVNRVEFYAGTDPSDGNSRLLVSSVRWEADDSGFIVTWPCVPGRTYQIQYSDSPGGPWSNDLANSLVVAPDGQLNLSYLDPTATAVPRRFYRVLLLLP